MKCSTGRSARVSAFVIIGVIVALATTGLAATGSAQAATPQRQRLSGQTITLGAEQFPASLNQYTPDGNTSWTAYLVAPVLSSGYLLLPDFSYKPDLFSKDCTVTSQKPFTVNCTVRANAKWSDGVALTVYVPW